jgi:hypothetical protein
LEGVDKMEKNSPSKKISVESTVNLKGIVKAVFNDTIHIQIGGKVIILPASALTLDSASHT